MTEKLINLLVLIGISLVVTLTFVVPIILWRSIIKKPIDNRGVIKAMLKCTEFNFMNYIPRFLQSLTLLLAVCVCTFISIHGTSAQTRSERNMELERQMHELMQAGKEEEAMKLYEQLVRQIFSGKIRLTGTIVNSEGKPLEDVRMEVITLEFDSLRSTDLKEIKQEQIVNDTFSYACDDCAGVRLEFKKEGYYREKIEYLTYAGDPPQKEVIKSDEKVVLEKRGVRVALENYSGTLKVGLNENDVLPFSFGQCSRAVPITRLAETAARKKHEGDVLYLELKVKRDANGEIATQEAQQAGSSYKLKKPVEPFLDFTRADGGVIVYQPKSRFVRKIDREMKRAPAVGYQPILTLDLKTNDTQYFYCRIGKHYCRGSISPVSVNSTKGNYASLHVSIRLNSMEGDTNLEF